MQLGNPKRCTRVGSLFLRCSRCRWWCRGLIDGGLRPRGHCLFHVRWCSYYERGEFPPGERSDGEVVYGLPLLSSEATVVLSIKVPIGMKRALQANASAAGTTTSAYARAILADAALR